MLRSRPHNPSMCVWLIERKQQHADKKEADELAKNDALRMSSTR